MRDAQDGLISAFHRISQVPFPASRCIARERLHEAKYMLDVIGESFIDFARLKELTNLAEGEVYCIA